jgi:TonB family protein
VILTFVVEKDGSLSNVKVLRAPAESLGDEAARVIALSPRWSPGTQNGKLVRVQYTVPISFTLNDNAAVTPAAKIDTGKKYFTLTFTKPGNKALVIIDGKEVKYGDLQLLNPNSIKSVDIFKDKKAIALYGSKAGNGVIVVKTKK